MKNKSNQLVVNLRFWIKVKVLSRFQKSKAISTLCLKYCQVSIFPSLND